MHFALRRGVFASAGRGTSGGVHKAVDDVSFDLAPGECLGLVGESGCGKTTIGRAVLRLVPATSGRVLFDGRDVLAARGESLRRLRREMQIIFQDPGGSLNPRMRVEEIVGEPIAVHGLARGRDAVRGAVTGVLERCGMPAGSIDRYPHEFSGGQKQRIAIARALALRPRMIVCDEPTSALDVSIQAQILNLLRDLQRELGLAYLFISHDIGVVDHLCTRIMVMKGGRVVEEGSREQVIGNPTHPYTRELRAAVPEAELQDASREAGAGRGA
ncbi:MAG: ATP-binding cassette domain-containing protein [Phycisphaerales bacterium]